MKFLLASSLVVVSLLMFPRAASAHAFGSNYVLPIPFGLYMYTASAVLLFSFLLIGFFFSKVQHVTSFPQLKLAGFPKFLVGTYAQRLYKSISLCLLLITILTGLIGEDLSGFNFNMTFFWVIFVVGFTYLSFLIGNIWEVVNPWKTMIEIFERISNKQVTGSITYPPRLRYYPALVLYMLFIAIELVVGTTPFSLSVLLLQYTFITCFAVVLFGQKAWFQYGEFFSVFFRFISYTSLLTSEKKNLILRPPFVGLLREKATDWSMLIFILFMLSSTAFDGIRDTNSWFLFYWDHAKPLLSHMVTETTGYVLFEIAGLLLSPFLFLILYLLSIFLMKVIIKTDKTVEKLAWAFAFSLVPIALVYHIAHYFTLLIIQGQAIVRLISNPFGWDWNLLGTATFTPNIGILQASFIWHFQVAVIVIGHIASVYLAHVVAVKQFSNHRNALISQIPMLILMVTYTVIGLWILSQPLSVGN